MSRSILLLACTLAASVARADRVMVDAPARSTTVSARRPPTCHAALALRDNVPREQQLGTELFTVPYLATSYDRYVYLTADERNDQRAAWTAALDELRDARCVVDVLFLAHGHDFASWIEAVPQEARPRLGLVYDTGGGDAAQGERWVEAGARSFVGHPDTNVAPVFYAFFLPAWLRGVPLEDAVARANERTRAVLHGLRRFLGEEQEAALWRGTRAVIFGDEHAVRSAGAR